MSIEALEFPVEEEKVKEKLFEMIDVVLVSLRASGLERSTISFEYKGAQIKVEIIK